MSDHKPKKKVAEPQAFGWMAEYEDENKLLDAARRVRDSGYTRTDAFTPFPVHGIDVALGIKPTVLPWFTLCAGATGTTVALVMQWWMNAFDYPYIISGKPFASWPAFIPVTFELTVLFSAFTTVFAMLGLNGLPKFSNPVFTNPNFDRSTDDRFFLWVDSRDKYFNDEKVQELLGDTGAERVEEVREDDSPTEVPKGILLTIFVLILVTLIPGSIILNMRNAKSGNSRLHVFFDMDFQPKRKAQTTTTIFDDGRVQRQPVAGTIARGELGLTDTYLLGYDPVATASLETGAAKLVSYQEEESTDNSDAVAEVSDTSEANSSESATEEDAAAAAELNYAWATEFPLDVDADLLELGKREFEQNCSVCHGYGGYGDGLVSQRAAALAQGYWLQPTSLHDDRVQAQAIGRIYYTIANGKGKMSGYAASLTPKERWAVVLYVRALQRSQNANAADVPEDAQ